MNEKIVEVFDREDFAERLMGNEDVARRILRGFLKELPQQVATLTQAVITLDAKALRMAAHSIKGAAASVGGLEMKELASRLEQTAIEGDLTAAAAALPELSASFERATLIMEMFCHEEATEPI